MYVMIKCIVIYSIFIIVLKNDHQMHEKDSVSHVCFTFIQYLSVAPFKASQFLEQ